MSRITIIPSDNVLLVDGEARIINMTGIDPKIHAVQWFNTIGEIEFNDRTPHQEITSITPFQSFIQLWIDAVPTPTRPRSDRDVTVLEVIIQLITDGIFTQAKIDAIKSSRGV